ncbi:dihydrolipoamide acetyltransferase family protein [Nakamurella sp. PAMC28650]|uniref:dihydrolipoamide acetyltransferase family protein n=1 Tax=Nakamurella sp. PAMC28650 TaxID=2762325 RepID=UPI00164EAE41|nr:dihydrolipoamide acetyltransferase family protein [Nakamurella sp. PAMC28650]QNK82352.1 2-oxo acid dehydrogenase subunit E2 [Nakamurella sp. PAMC28650]
MPRIRTFPMPDVGEGLTEAEILTWHVSVGDTLTVNQIMVEIETAKAAVELPSPFAGLVTALLVEPGVTVDVGTPIISIDTDPGGVEVADVAGPVVSGAGTGSGVAGGAAEEAGAKIGEMTADGRIATLVGYVSASPGTARRARRSGAMRTVDDLGFDLDRIPKSAAPAVQQPVVAEPEPVVQLPVVAEPEPAVKLPVSAEPAPVVQLPVVSQLAPKATPPVRKLAKDLGVDLMMLSAGRADGVISRAEVEAAAAPAEPSSLVAPLVAPSVDSYDAQASYERVPGATSEPAAAAAAAAPAAPAAPTVKPRETRVPIKGIRKMTAQAMVASAFTAPHVTEFLTVDVTPMMELRDKVRKRPEFADVKVSPLAFAAFAVCLASRRTPEINSVWDGDAGEIVIRNYVNLGIAAATPRGLIVPVIGDADQLDLRGIAMALGALTDKARAGRTPPTEMTGGTFTITNVGIFGVDTGTPIINPGESAILAIGSIKDAPWVVDGQLAVRKVCQLSLSFDHRVIDGEQGSQFLADVGALLADPGLSLVF